jgi:D-alanyl-D-alanine carboxypeptidase
MRALLNIGLNKGAAEVTRKRAVVAAASLERDKVVSVRPQPNTGPASALPAEAAKSTVPVAASPRIEMAQVRPILVGRSARIEAGAADAVTAPTTIEALIERSLRREPPGPERDEPSAAAEDSGVPAPERSGPRLARASLAEPTLLAQPRLIRGSPPSTLEQQALHLNREEQADATGARSTASTGGGLEIQIGAFPSASEAQRRLAWVRQRATAVVGRHEAVTQPVKQGDKLFYRARFAGFDGAAAASACKELRALKVDCLIIRSD